MALSFTGNLEGGASGVVGCGRADAMRVRVRRDNRYEFAQWFYVRLTGAGGERCVMTVEDGNDCADRAGWRDYRAVESYD
ncbi:M14-type cytosolic carboxypeptidase, partial [Burkholderia pseudomallei]|uniref:M14-type cytosolic carboxypeptidase n=1 Tax=Burkholderia pseudomallei TaxID=28450 RepID=UPI0021F7CD64